MAAALLGSPWERYADLSPADADALADPASAYAKVGPEIRYSATSGGTQGTMGYFCYFNMDGGTDADYTHHFDFPINGDFTIVCNALAGDLPSNTTMDLSVQGSMIGTDGTWVDLHEDIMDGVTICDSGAGVAVAKVYDYDAIGRMPFMRLELTAARAASNETILLAVIPH